MREILVPVGFRLPLEVLQRIDAECERAKKSAYHKITRSEVIVAALRRALPAAASEQKKSNDHKPRVRRRRAA